MRAMVGHHLTSVGPLQNKVENLPVRVDSHVLGSANQVEDVIINGRGVRHRQIRPLRRLLSVSGENATR